MKKGHIAKLDINVLLLKHPSHKFENFEEEVQYIINHEKRNNFIRNLALDLKGNTLILFSRVEGHGQPLFELINNHRIDDRHVFFVHGGVATEDREKVRTITESENDAIIIASYGTFSTGINIKIYTMLFLLLHQSQESEISNQLVEYSEKETTKPRQHYMISLTTYPTNPGKIIHLIIS